MNLLEYLLILENFITGLQQCQVAKTLLHSGIPLAMIQKVTQLSLEQIEQINDNT